MVRFVGTNAVLCITTNSWSISYLLCKTLLLRSQALLGGRCCSKFSILTLQLVIAEGRIEKGNPAFYALAPASPFLFFYIFSFPSLVLLYSSLHMKLGTKEYK
ncbi:hypothetical protein E2542_SST10522 [Spatholobus suberectus]|nr:hypothetical protein E2542_SST10522 [Spatholobus suberectus]